MCADWRALSVPESHRTAAPRAFSANFPITQGDAVFKSRVHAAAACVLPSRAVQGRPGGTRDQARQPQLIPAGGPHAARK